jgi:endoglucanase
LKVATQVVLLAGALAGVVLLGPRPLGVTGGSADSHAYRGVSLAGAEFGTHVPGFGGSKPGTFGTDYTYCTPQTMRYFAQLGLTHFRIPVRWERLQGTPGGALDGTELGRVFEALDAASQLGCRVVLDLHNYGRYCRGESRHPNGRIVGAPAADGLGITQEHLSDLWCKLSDRLRGHQAIEAFAIMNEPHDMGRASWRKISQHVVDALRFRGDRTTLWISGDGWSSAHNWQKNNGSRAWIVDPFDNVVYEAHCYFDHDFSGTYKLSFAEEQSRDGAVLARGISRLAPFLDWCRRNGVRGVIGECGVPRDEPGWLPALAALLKGTAERQTPVYYWAAGEWWDDNPLSIQPRGGEQAAPLRVLLGR